MLKLLLSISTKLNGALLDAEFFKIEKKNKAFQILIDKKIPILLLLLSPHWPTTQLVCPPLV